MFGLQPVPNPGSFTEFAALVPVLHLAVFPVVPSVAHNAVLPSPLKGEDMSVLCE